MKYCNVIAAISLGSLLPACNMGLMTIQHEETEETEEVEEVDEADRVSGMEGVNSSESSNLSESMTDEIIEPDPILNHTSFGERCVGGDIVRYLVLSSSPVDCAAHAEAIDTVSTSGAPVETAVFELDSLQVSESFEYCVSPDDCSTTDLTFDVKETGAEVSGSWTGSPTGVEQTVRFSAVQCDYDSLVTPLPSDILATDISIDEVSVYQGVKIPVFENGVAVSDRNAPIVAKRPGLVRVFLEPGEAWQPRELIARLTVGDMMLEERITPHQTSTEMQRESTVNFDFASGELPAGADVSVELFEAESCPLSGTQERPRVPETDSLALEANEIGPMRIRLIPIQYEADGSGRVPNLGQATLDRFRNEALSHYPVEDIDLSVANPVATDIELSARGRGFSALLNFCVNVRSQDDPDPEVYYYCVVQPGDDLLEYCGDGCVGGVAAVPDAMNVEERAAVGLGFDRIGEETFVHEIAHTLGRRHSPCGGPSNPDPDYPHAEGAIGSWGYDILSGNLVEPDRADFMGYCDPAWVSDYTYSRIFDRLEEVMTAQSFLSFGAEQSWRTAAIQDGEISWGADRVLRATPGGAEVLGSLRGLDGSVVAEPRIFVTPVADVDAVLLTVEDAGVSADTLEVPGLGRFSYH